MVKKFEASYYKLLNAALSSDTELPIARVITDASNNITWEVEHRFLGCSNTCTLILHVHRGVASPNPGVGSSPGKKYYFFKTSKTPLF